MRMCNPIPLHLNTKRVFACYYCNCGMLSSPALMLHLVSMLFGTSIPTSFNILVIIFLLLQIFYTCIATTVSISIHSDSTHCITHISMTKMVEVLQSVSMISMMKLLLQQPSALGVGADLGAYTH